MKAFISYSHKDAHYAEDLHKHLAMLKSEGAIEAWYDCKILPGDALDKSISDQLQKSELFLALVSPDFLASKYCIEIELETALRRHEEGEIRLVPIILEPCDWLNSPLKILKALPTDGKPVSDFTNRNNAFLNIVTGLRRIISETTKDAAPKVISTQNTTDVLKSDRYKPKRSFDEIDKSDFRQKAFEKIRDYIQSSIREIDSIDDIKARFLSLTATSFTCTILNKARNNTLAALTVHAGSRMMGDIYYSHAENAADNTSNGGFRIEADDYSLYFKPSFSMSYTDTGNLNTEQVAERIWNDLLDRADIGYA